MSRPYLCPKCEGEGTIDVTTPTSMTTVPCPVCKGAMVLWSPEPDPASPLPGGVLGEYQYAPNTITRDDTDPMV